MPTLHAFLVGIDSYKNENISDLKSCKIDVQHFESFLRNCNPNIFELVIDKMIDQNATKNGIVEKLCTILEELKDDDIFVWYFSGHGCQETPDEVWKVADSNRNLECLVCHDLDFMGNGCLADKEIRFIFHKFLQDKKVEVITIFDSCHSGDATRNDLIPKRLNTLLNKRGWHQFEFGKNLPIDLFKNAELDTLIPLTKHFHIAACRDTELAYQSASGSVLTSSLIRVVEQSDLVISYNILEGRLMNSVRNNYSQTPNIEAIGHEPDRKNTIFLKGGIIGKSQSFDVHYSKEEGVWQLDLGRIHGISSVTEKKVIIYSNDTPIVNGEIEEVFLTTTSLNIEDEFKLDKNLFYNTTIKGLYLEKTFIYLQGNAWGKDELATFLNQKKIDLQRFNICLVDEISLANFSVLAVKDVDKFGVSTKRYLITPPIIYDETNNDKIISFTDEVFGFNEESAAKVLSNLQKVAHWKYVLSINNESKLRESVELKIINKKDERVNLQEKTILSLQNGDEIRFEIVNNSDEKIFIRCFLINQTFGIHQLIDTANSPFTGKSNKFVPRDKFLKVKSKFPNLPYETVWLKVIFATEEIKLSNFEQADLINTRSSTAPKGSSDTNLENLDFSSIDETWGTLTFEIRAFINPPIS